MCPLRVKALFFVPKKNLIRIAKFFSKNPNSSSYRFQEREHSLQLHLGIAIVIHVEKFILDTISFVSIRKYYVPPSRDDSNNCQFFNLSFIATRARASERF